MAGAGAGAGADAKQDGPGRDRLLVAVLMAGLGTRFGGGKLAAPCAGQPLGAWAFATVQALAAPLLAVVGPAAPDWLPAGVARAVNPRPEAGLGGSVALAARTAADRGAESLLIVLADMPLVRLATLDRLVALTAQHGMAATLYPDGRRGVPAGFRSTHFAALAGLAGEAGARTLLRACPAGALVAPDPVELIDVDRPQDLAAAATHLAAPGAG